MTRTRLSILAPSLVLSLVLSLAADVPAAQEEAPPGAGGFLEAPVLAPTPIAGDPVEPDITIVESSDRTVYEYRVRGHLYMVRVQPQLGPPYFLFDLDGDGILEEGDPSPTNTAIPQWILFSWD